MATIERRTSDDGRVAYRVKIRLQGHPAESATFNRLTDAKRWASDTEAKILEGKYFATRAARKHTVTQAVDKYVAEVLTDKQGNPTRRSATDIKRQLDWWKEQIGWMRLSDLTPPRIAEAKEALASGRAVRGKNKATEASPLRSPATVNRYMAALSKVLTHAAKEWHWIESNPFIGRVAKLPEPSGRVRFLSDKERKALLEGCETSSRALHTIVVLALSTGARQAEILTLTWPQIDIERGAIYLERTKNGERRTLPLTGHAKTLVEALKEKRDEKVALLFPSHRDKAKPLDIHSVFAEAVATAGIEDFRFHDLRHTAASYLAMNGATLLEIAQILGHKTLSMVKRYSHLTEQHTASVVKKMNQKMFGGAK
jgi:integrase